MTLSTTTNKVSYNGNGSTTAFAVPFLFLANTHIRVVFVSTAGVETDWVENTQYTLTGALNPAGGTVTVKVAPTDYTPQINEQLLIVREVPQTQETDYVENQDFPAASHETALDKLTMEVQQLQEQTERAVLFPISSVLSSLEFPTPVAGYAIGWNATEDALENLVPTVENLPATADRYHRRNSAGTAWESRTFAEVFSDTKQDATETATGVVELATVAEVQTGTDTTRAVTAAGVTAAIGDLELAIGSGFPILRNDTDTDHDIESSIGSARDSTNADDIVFSAVMTKQIDANWALGDDAGGFPSALTIANSTTYHHFWLKNSTTGAVDAGFDTSLIATNLLADATGFDLYAYIGAVITDGSANILEFIQNKNSVRWVVIPTDHSGGVAAATLTALSVPLGIKVEAVCNIVTASTTATGAKSASAGIWDPALGSSVNKLDVGVSSLNNNEISVIGNAQAFTNTAAQVYLYKTGTVTGNFTIQTPGWNYLR